MRYKYYITTQIESGGSDTTHTESKSGSELTSQNVNFVDGDSPWQYELAAMPDPSTKLVDFNDADLGNFLSRPVKIQEYDWVPTAQLFESFDPWSDFVSDPAIVNKIAKYRNLRMNLKLKVIINGNGFYYGRALLSYNPYLYADDVTMNRAFFDVDLVQASQKPHILIDPTSSQGGEMTLPFIWHHNALDITQANYASMLGRCTIHDFSSLEHANGGTSRITVSVYAWAEDVCLTVPTTHNPGLVVPQSDNKIVGNRIDEHGFPMRPSYENQASKKKNRKVSNTMAHGSLGSTNDEFSTDGLISKPASAIAKAANAMSMIPMLAPYAKATEMVATKVGQIARLFGYSRPQIMSDVTSFKPRFIGNLCNSDTPESLVKLSLDSKNELSIDTRIFGLGGADELAIASIASRWSYWRQFDWLVSDGAETLLASIKVSPNYTGTMPTGNSMEIHSTALAFAAAPFEAWQGSIKFRFNVVCSEYHRGRLRLVYNPRTSPGGPIPYNTVYSTVIDISEDRDFEYEVKWADIKAWARNVPLYDTAYQNSMFADLVPVSVGNDNDNGSLSLYVVNELATPGASTADIKVQVWVAGGDDFAVAIPSSGGLDALSVFPRPQSGTQLIYTNQADEEMLATTQDDSNAPTEVTPIPTFGDSLKTDNQFLVYQGEQIVSFRELLRRYNYSQSWWPSDYGGDNPRILTMPISIFPPYRGHDPGGKDSTTGFPNYTFSGETLLNYLTPAFAIQRGAIRHKFIASGIYPQGALLSAQRSRAQHEIVGNPSAVLLNNASIGDRKRVMFLTKRNGFAGMHMTPISENPTLEVEVPYYSLGKRFEPGRMIEKTSQPVQTLHVATEVDTVLVGAARVDDYISIGEDFQVGLYVGPPTMYGYVDPSL